MIKRQIVEAFAEEIFSIIADDDSILLILKDEKNLQAILKVIKNW